MKKDKGVIREGLLGLLQQLMGGLEVPDWLQGELITILKSKKQKMTEEEIYQYLKQLGESKINILPDEFINEEWLRSIYASHKQWVESETSFLEELTYESFETHLETSPKQVKDMSNDAQRAYIAISTSLLNVFAQIDDAPYEPKSVKGNKNSGNYKKVFHLIKSIIGYSLIFTAYLFAIVAFTTVDEEGLSSYFGMYIFMGLVPFMIGLFIVRDVTIKNFYKQQVFRIYCYFTFVVPCSLIILTMFKEWKRNLLIDPDHIYLSLTSDPWLGILKAIILTTITILAAPIVISKKRGKKLLKYFSFFIIAFVVLQYASIYDYQSIEKDKVVDSFFGMEREYEWNEVESVFLSGSAPDEDFVWSFHFNMENGDDVSFSPFGYHEGSLNLSLKIKEKIKKENVPIQIGQLTEEDRTFVKIDMKYEQGLKDEFFKLFAIDSFE